MADELLPLDLEFRSPRKSLKSEVVDQVDKY
jgi:hypothetical protein